MKAHWAQTPIRPHYPTVGEAEREKLVQSSAPALLKDSPWLRLDQRYFKDGLKGATDEMYARLAVAERLENVARTLHAAGYGLWIFDAFRSKVTQRDLFERIYAQIKATHPDWEHPQLYTETRRYVAHPEEVSRFPINPHNSGGAVDLTMHQGGVPCEMGTVFDDPSEVASTDYFEKEWSAGGRFDEKQWQGIRERRRILFHALTEVGFTNYDAEWWHYDLGNCLWGSYTGVPWVFDSMEPAVDALKK